jgi:hypothetical protein
MTLQNKCPVVQHCITERTDSIVTADSTQQVKLSPSSLKVIQKNTGITNVSEETAMKDKLLLSPFSTDLQNTNTPHRETRVKMCVLF